MATTITYDEINKGWTSFHSYEPEWMDRLGNNFYTFKNGNLYLHEASPNRSTFYGVSYPTTITFSANKEPSTVKVFKNLGLETNYPLWTARLESDIETGIIPTGKFEDKEGVKYGYIRRYTANNTDFNELSIIGLGELQEDLPANSFGFLNNIPPQVTINSNDTGLGDRLFVNDTTGGSIGQGEGVQEVGVISGINGNVISTYLIAHNPVVGDFCFVVKNAAAESFGLRGYHATIKLESSSVQFLELYAVNSEVMKSYM
jgi:hypothetical protein